jgi:hypothetical protein
MFPESSKVDGFYKTKFGGASHNGVIYGNTNNNLRYAVRRLFGKRVPEVPGRHEELFRMQENFVAQNEVLFSDLRFLYLRVFDDYTDSETEARLHYADPHEKKELRIKALEELKEDNKLTDPLDPWAKSVWQKLKRNEWAKPGKKPRAICDLGVACSLRGFRITNFLKNAQDSYRLDHPTRSL